MMNAFDLFQQSYLASKLTPLGIREFIYLNSAPCDLWLYQDDFFKIFLKQNQEMTQGMIRELIQRGIYQIFVDYNELEEIQKAQQQNLVQITRSLSIGDTVKNAKHQMSLLSINMAYLFKDPINDQALDLQFQSAKNLVNFAVDNEKKLPQFFSSFSRQKHHYTISQPLLSSIILAGFLKYTKHFSEREIEMLFLVSYFKDIGMALIPSETYDKQDLDDSERKLVNNHSQHSLNILQGRVPFNPNYLNIIGQHHSHSLIRPVDEDIENYMVTGIETKLVVMMDVLTAMISPRPYRSGLNLYDALNRIKVLYSKEHPREYKYLIHFVQRFFSKLS